LAAPGGDDDGSGVTQLLSIARAIHRKGVSFNVDVELVAFAGEEQGLLGSHAYASTSSSHHPCSISQPDWDLPTEELYEDGADIMLMIQADMLAYHDADEPLQLGLPET
jgi:Zn-dependent M28 family amino/carboxypeptidase